MSRARISHLPQAVQALKERRMQIGAYSGGGYNGAKIDRASLAGWHVRAGSATRDVLPDLPALIARSRDLNRNNPIVTGAINVNAANTIGTGLALAAEPDGAVLGLTEKQVEDWAAQTLPRFLAWFESTACDHEGQLNGYQLQDMVWRSRLESGDCFPLLMIDRASQRLKIQVIEGDRVCNEKLAADSESVKRGIKLNADNVPIGAYIAQSHPGDVTQPAAWDYRPFRTPSGRRALLQVWHKTRPGQLRGVPWVAPIIEPLKNLGTWTSAELRAAVVNAIFAKFIEMDPQAFQDIFDDEAQGKVVEKASQWSGEIEDGKVINLLPGEKVSQDAPGRPNPEFDPFFQSMMTQIGMALSIPKEVLMMHFSSSYSAARGSLMVAFKSFMKWRDDMVTQFCQPIYEAWLEIEVAFGRIQAPGFFESDVIKAAWCRGIWTGDGPGSVDPEKEVNAAEKRINIGISTKDIESRQWDGRPWKLKHRQRVREINAEKEDGIYIPPAGSPPPPPEPSTEPSPAQQAATEAAEQRRLEGQRHAEQMQMLSGMFASVSAMAAAPKAAPEFNFTMPPVQVNNEIAPPEVHAHFEATMPSPEVHAHFEATMPSPEVHAHFEANVPETTVLMQHPTSAVATHQRDPETMEIVATHTQYITQTLQELK